MFEDVANFLRETAGETGKPRRGGRGGGQAGSERDSARDFARDRAFELSLRGLSDYQRQLRETERQYAVLIAQAGKDNALRTQLIGLREQEMELIRREQVAGTVAAFQEFLGLANEFDGVRKTAADLIARINDSPFGDARKATMIGRVMGEVERQITRMSREMAAGLGSQLLADLQQYGATEEQQLALRQSMALLEHALNIENYRITIDKLRAEGKLAPELIQGFEDAYAYLAGLDWAAIVNPVGTGGGAGAGGGGSAGPYNGPVFQGYEDANTAIQSVGDSLAEMTELLQRYRDQGLSPYQLALRDLNADFARIRAVLGDTAEVSLQYQLAIARLRDEYLSSMRDFYDEITTGPMSGLSVESQYAAALANWNSLTNAIATTGDLSLSDEAVAAAQQAEQLAAQLWGTTTGGYQALLAQFRATMEALGIGGASAGTGSTASSLFAGLAPDLLAGVTGALQSAGEALAPQAGTQAQVDATEGVEDAIEVHGARQERLLGDLIGRLDALIGLMRAGGGSHPDRPAGTSWPSGNPAAALSFSYGDQPTFPQLTRRR